jgi:hypothetical protein
MYPLVLIDSMERPGLPQGPRKGIVGRQPQRYGPLSWSTPFSPGLTAGAVFLVVGHACAALPNFLFNNLTLLCIAQSIPKLFDFWHGLTRQSTLRPMQPGNAAYPHISKTWDGSSDARFRLQFLRGSPGRGRSAASGRRDSYLIPRVRIEAARAALC